MDDWERLQRDRFFNSRFAASDRESYEKYYSDWPVEKKREAVLTAMLAAENACEPNGVGSEHVWMLVELLGLDYTSV